MSEIMPYRLSDNKTSLSRRAARAVERNSAELDVKSAAVEGEAELAGLKAYTLGNYAGSLYPLIARDAEARRRIEQAYPEVAGDLAYISRAMVGGIAAISDNLVYRLGRI